MGTTFYQQVDSKDLQATDLTTPFVVSVKALEQAAVRYAPSFVRILEFHLQGSSPALPFANEQVALSTCIRTRRPNKYPI